MPRLKSPPRMSPETSATARLRGLISGFAGKRILVIGDLMLDEFIWGKVSRISPEAPVPVVNVTGESYYPGGAANVARNVREFTSETAVMGLVGTDDRGRRLVELLAAGGLDTSGVLEDPAASTTVKTRIIARNQQVVRVDRERVSPLATANAERAMEHLDRIVAGLDAIIVADYGKGFLTQPLADHICRAAEAHGKVLAVDPHPHTSLAWRGATAIKPNRAEAFAAAGLPPADPVTPVLSDRASARSGEAAAGSLASRQPPDYARRARHVAAPARRRAVPHPHARAGRLRCFRRRRYRHRRFHPGSCRRSHARRGRRAGQPRQRHRGGQTGHRHRQPRRTPMTGAAPATPVTPAAPAVFFDRDGTLMEEVHYCADPALVRVYPGVPQALRQLKAAGFRTFIVTNQSGIGRGLFTEAAIPRRPRRIPPPTRPRHH